MPRHDACSLQPEVLNQRWHELQFTGAQQECNTCNRATRAIIQLQIRSIQSKSLKRWLSPKPFDISEMRPGATLLPLMYSWPGVSPRTRQIGTGINLRFPDPTQVHPLCFTNCLQLESIAESNCGSEGSPDACCQQTTVNDVTDCFFCVANPPLTQPNGLGTTPLSPDYDFDLNELSTKCKALGFPIQSLEESETESQSTSSTSSSSSSSATSSHSITTMTSQSSSSSSTFTAETKPTGDSGSSPSQNFGLENRIHLSFVGLAPIGMIFFLYM
ncbi:hypothetical protein VKT23_018219 [Stygiomarasmius scandens]|uniref:Uncharacterized protein n=1 Tax=Marasmiellus scandens TaxID=2682957 RepID=A0ABR1IRC0_9AGAR